LNTIDNGQQCHISESKGKDDRKIHYVTSLIYYALGFIHLFNSTSEISHLECPESAAHQASHTSLKAKGQMAKVQTSKTMAILANCTT